MTRGRSILALIALVVAGCGDTGGGFVQLPLMGGGVRDADRFVTSSGWDVTMEDARIAFGPAYFCATTSADLDNCPAAIAELRGAVTIDAMHETTEALGTIEGRAGTLRSGLWDYGRPFFLPDTAPTAIAGAVDGAHSAVLVGSASRGGVTFRFVAVLDVSAPVSGITAVHGVRTRHTLADDADGLTVRFDVPAIIERLDLDALAATAVDGEARIEEGSAAYTALVQALTLNELPTLEWARAD